MPQAKRIESDEHLPFALTTRERDLILDHTFISPQIEGFTPIREIRKGGYLWRRAHSLTGSWE